MKAFSLILISLLAISFSFAGIIYVPKNVTASQLQTSDYPVVNQTQHSSGKKAGARKLFIKVFKKKISNIASFVKKSGEKSKVVAIILAIFLGRLGIHDFYLGNKRAGFIKLGIYIVAMILYISGYIAVYTEVVDFPITLLIGAALLLILGIWSIVDAIRIGTGKYQPVDGYFRD